MDQEWHWYNLTKRQSLFNDWKKGLNDWLFGSSPAGLPQLLGQVEDLPHPLENELETLPIPAALLCVESGDSEQDPTRRRCTLASLPRELLDQIFEETEEYFDLVSFAFTCRFLVDLGYRHLNPRRRQFIASWAGDVIVCFGDHGNSLPKTESHFSHEFIDEIASHKIESFTPPRRRNDIIYKLMLFQPPSWLDYMHADPRRASRVRGNTLWTLRNLSTKEYVREDFARFVDLGHVLTFRCSWSDSDGPFVAPGLRGLDKGKWAGDRFDIVPFDEEADWAKEWEDVGAELEAEIISGFRAENHWHDEIWN